MSDSPEPSPEILREFLDAEKVLPDPSPDVQQRVLTRLSATLGIAVDVPLSSPSPSPPVSPPATGSPIAGIIGHGARRGLATFLVGAAVGATVYGTVAHVRQTSRPTEAPVVAPRPLAPIETALPLAAEPKVAEEVPQKPLSSAPSITCSPLEATLRHARDAGLAAERKWVEMARTALARGRVDGALASLRHHARHYPKGQLAEERDSLLVQVLVAKGDYAQARARASRFDRQHPHSLFSQAIKQALQSIP